MRKYIFILSLLCGISAKAQYNLEQCQQMALQNNRTLQNARLDASAADEDKAIAFTKYFPSVSASATGFIGARDLMRTEMDLTEMGATIGPMLVQMGMADMLANMPTTYSASMLKKGFMANAIATQPIYAGGQIINGNKLAALQQEVRRLQTSMTERQVMQSVNDYYWQIVALQSNVATLDAAEKQLDAIHKMTNDYVEAGVINRNDLLTVQLKQQEMKSTRLQVDNGIRLLQLVLAQLCGAEDLQAFTIATDSNLDNMPSPESVFVAPAEAVLQRDEYALVSKAEEATALQVKMERGKLLPTVAVGAVGLYQYMNMGSNFKDMNNGNLVGFATVSVPITDWWGGKHSIRKARIAQQQAVNNRLEAQEKLQVDILSSWNNLTEAYAQIEVASTSVESAAENLRLSTDQYKAGTELMSDLLNAVTLDVKARNALTSAQATYQSRLADYLSKTRK